MAIRRLFLRVIGSASGLTLALSIAAMPVPAIAAVLTPSGSPGIGGTRTIEHGTLWYNGDLDGVNGLANASVSTEPTFVHDDFNVTAPGWVVSDIWTNNLINSGIGAITQAFWEIRSGVSAGNGGTLVAGGITSAATQTATGNSAFGQLEYEILVSGLSVSISPGTYWLMVAPVLPGISTCCFSFVSTTSGANAVGTPAGNNDNSFLHAPWAGLNYDPASNSVAVGTADFSMGIDGTFAAPEPITLALLGLGLVGLGFTRRRLH